MNKIIHCVSLCLLLMIAGCSKETKVASRSDIKDTLKVDTDATVFSNAAVNPVSLSSENKSVDSKLKDEDHIALFERELTEQLKAEMGEEAFKNSYKGKMHTKDPKIMFNLSDHDPERQKIMREELEFIKVNGYAHLSQEEMDDYHNTKKDLYSHSDASDSARFELSKLPEDLTNSYEGYTREGVSPNAASDVKAPVIRRAFNYNGSTILLQEESGKNGVTHFTKEFVNEKISDYPGIFANYRSPDNKKIYELKWCTDKYRYQLNSISNKSIEEERAILRKLANEITLLNNGNAK